MHKADERPVVGLTIPGGSSGHLLSLQSHYMLAGKDARIVPMLALSSAANFNHNSLLANGLNLQRKGIMDYLLIHHADVEVRTSCWLDVMLAEMQQYGAGVLAGVCSKKNDSGMSNMAYSTPNEYFGNVMSLEHIWSLPKTFSIADTPHPDRELLVNTGLMLIDLRLPQWRQYKTDPDGTRVLKFCFQMRDRIAVDEDDDCHAQFASEDWNFSKQCARNGIPVYCTQKVQIIHHGECGFDNWPKENQPVLEQTTEDYVRLAAAAQAEEEAVHV